MDKKKRRDKEQTPFQQKSRAEEISVEQLQQAFRKECKNKNISTIQTQCVYNLLKDFIENEEEKGPLKQLCIGGDIGSQVCAALCDAIVKSKYDKLHTYCFWRAGIGDEGALHISQHIANCPSLKKLELRDCGVSHVGIQALAEGILKNNSSIKTSKSKRRFKTLETIRLDFNKIGDAGILHLSNGLEFNRSLKRLSLQYCGIGSTQQAVQGITQIFSSFPSIDIDRELDLQGNSVKTSGCDGIVKGLQNIRSQNFWRLNLSENGIGENCGLYINCFDVIYLRGICLRPKQYFSLHYHCIYTKLNETEKDDLPMIQTLVDAFANCQTLKHLQMESNFFEEEVCFHYAKNRGSCCV
ncbi:hypothetical protein RFI_00156 [Reticulomyxa filosa]|uniref:Uncharacterized protein n=1 Tax=Reticulomyxa filosa TaxID=46433 RepID=X6PGW1_RETFI|nr:hypothetical protein RFI_00156 [Reticulomyxa filosa]|eukprot:ETO36907.1 hypothetical protein RFI_00156 [Reticulomyxa filosa]